MTNTALEIDPPSTFLEDELGVLGYQWSTSKIQQPDLALGALCKRDVYSSGFKKIPLDRCMKRPFEKLFKKFSEKFYEKLVFVFRE